MATEEAVSSETVIINKYQIAAGSKKMKNKSILKNLSDEQTIELVIKDKEIFGVIIDRYEKRLKNYLFHLTKDKEKINDIVQNTFIKTYVNLNSFNKKMKFSSWIFRIAHNEAINLLKKESFFKPIDFNFFLNLKDDKNDAEEILNKETKNIVKKCLDQLAFDYREIVVLYYFEEKSYEEISDILRISVNNVGVKLNRAKKMLKKICQNIS